MELPNIINNKDHKLYDIFSHLLFLLSCIFSPQGEMARNALVFYLVQENWETCNIYKTEGGNWSGKYYTRGLTAEQEKICHSGLRLAAVVAFPLLQAEGQARKGQFIPCDWSSSSALPQGPGPPLLPWDCSQRSPTQLRRKEHSLGIHSTSAQSKATSTFGLTVTEVTNILPVVARRVMAKAEKTSQQPVFSSFRVTILLEHTSSTSVTGFQKALWRIKRITHSPPKKLHPT